MTNNFKAKAAGYQNLQLFEIKIYPKSLNIFNRG